MAVYEVSYDLRKPGRNYEPLYERLRQYDCCRPLESVWLLDTTQSAETIRDYLKAVMDANDGILVTRMHGEWAASGINEHSLSWLKRRFP